MATGILLKRPPAPKPPFQPPTSYGINRLPPPEPLDPEKFVGLGLDLSTRAREQTAQACGLFRLLDEFARLNRDNLANEDVVNVLTDLREEAEVVLERGFYAFDVATEVLTRIGRHEPVFGEIITKEGRDRWRSYFHSLRGVLARAYKGMYEMVLATPTCGDLSHIPPKLHFAEPALVMKRRYDRRLGLAVVAGHDEGKEYWRRRLVKGVGSGALPGQVVLRNERTGPARRRKGAGKHAGEDPAAAPVGRRAPGEFVEGTTTYYRIDDYRQDWTEDYNPVGPGTHAETGQGQAAENTPTAPSQEPSNSNLMLLASVASASDARNKDPTSGDQTQGALGKSAQAGDAPGTGRRSSRLQARRESASAAGSAPNVPAPAPRPTPAPARARARAPKKRKRAPAGKAGKGGGPAAKRQRRLSVQFAAEEGQDMRPLSNAELAQLPWNVGMPGPSEVDPRKWVPSFPGRRSQGIDMFPHLMAWARYEDPAVYEGAEPGDEPIYTGVDTRMDDTMGVDMEDTMDLEDDMDEDVANMEDTDDDHMDMGRTRLSDIVEDNEDNETVHNQSRRTSPAPTQPVEETSRGPPLSVASPAGGTLRGPPLQDFPVSKTLSYTEPGTTTPADTPKDQSGLWGSTVVRKEKIDHQRRLNRTIGDTTSEFLQEDTAQVQSSPPGDQSRTPLKITTFEFLKEDTTQFQSSPPDGRSRSPIGITTSEFLREDTTRFQSSPPDGRSRIGAGDTTSEVLGRPSDMPPPSKPAERAPRRRKGSGRFNSSTIGGDQPTATGAPGSGVSGPGPSTHAGVGSVHGWCPGGLPAEPVQAGPTLPKLPDPKPSTKGLQKRVPYSSGLWTSPDRPRVPAPEAQNITPQNSPLGAPADDETEEHSSVSEGVEETYQDADPTEAETSPAEDSDEADPTEPSTGASQTPPPSVDSFEEEGTTNHHWHKYEPESPAPRSPLTVFAQAGPSQPRKTTTNPPSGNSAGATPDQSNAISREQQVKSDAEFAQRLALELGQEDGVSQLDVERVAKAAWEAEKARGAADDASAQVQAENDDALDRAQQGAGEKSKEGRSARAERKAEEKARKKAERKAEKRAEKKAQKEKAKGDTQEKDSDQEMTDPPEEHARGDSDVEKSNATDPPADQGDIVMTDAEWERRANMQPREETHQGWNESDEPIWEKQWTC